MYGGQMLSAFDMIKSCTLLQLNENDDGMNNQFAVQKSVLNIELNTNKKARFSYFQNDDESQDSYGEDSESEGESIENSLYDDFKTDMQRMPSNYNTIMIKKFDNSVNSVRKILLVDDEPYNHLGLQIMLKAAAK